MILCFAFFTLDKKSYASFGKAVKSGLAVFEESGWRSVTEAGMRVLGSKDQKVENLGWPRRSERKLF